jgi:hypothetical protein
MPSFPNRCQHIKVNGTQCGSPALRRNRFCYFHKRHHEERVALSADRAKATRRRNAAIDLPVLEDANSIQVSLMQIMRLIVAGQLDNKTAGLLLYALQTASVNLARTNFEPLRNSVILDPAAVGETPFGAQIWSDSDFISESDDEEEEEGPAHIKTIKAKYGAALDAIKLEPPAPKPPERQLDVRGFPAQVHDEIEKAVPGLHAAYAAIKQENPADNDSG